MNFKILYEDNDILAIDKPSKISVFPEGNIKEKTLIDFLLEKYPELKKTGAWPRYGIVHRLDKDTSGILIVAKNKNDFIFLQDQFLKKEIKKEYTALIDGKLKNSKGTIDSFIGRNPQNKKKQKVFLLNEPVIKNPRKALRQEPHSHLRRRPFPGAGHL